MWNIPEVINLGPFIVPLHYILFAVIGYTTTYVIYLTSKALNTSHKTWLEILLNGLIAYIVVWKFSFILFNPLAIIQNPSLILLGSGGFLGNVLGILVGLIVLYRSAKKANYSYVLFVDLFMYWLILTLTVYWTIIPSLGSPTTLPWGIRFENSTMSYHPLHWYTLILGAFILLYLKMKKVRFGSGQYTSLSLLLFGLGLLFISNFSYQQNPFLGLSPLQWLYLSMAVIGLTALVFLNKRNNTNTPNSEIKGC
jgi:hypothetical protein